MAHCDAEGRKHPTMDLYVGIFNSKLYGSNKSNGNAGHYDNWHRFDAPVHSESFRKDHSADKLSFHSKSFREGASRLSTFNGFVEGFSEKKAPFKETEAKPQANHEMHRSVSQFNGWSVRNDTLSNSVKEGGSGRNTNSDSVFSNVNKNGIDSKSAFSHENGYDRGGLRRSNCPIDGPIEDVEAPYTRSSAIHNESRDMVCPRRSYGSDRSPEGRDKRSSSGFTGNSDSSFEKQLNGYRMQSEDIGFSRRYDLPADNVDTVPARQSNVSSTGTSESGDGALARSSTSSSSGKLSVWDDGLDAASVISGELTSFKKKSGELDAPISARNSKSGELNCGLRMDELNSTKTEKSGELYMGFAGGGGRLDAFSRNHRSGDFFVPAGNGVIKSHKSGEQDASPYVGSSFKHSPSRVTLKESPGRENPFVGNLKIGGTNVMLDSSSSNGGSSNGGSPTAEVAKDTGRLQSFGNILGGKGGSNSGSFRSIGSIMGTGNSGNGKITSSRASTTESSVASLIPPRSSNGSGRKSGEMLLSRKSGEILPNSNCNVKGVVTPKPSAEGSATASINWQATANGNVAKSNGSILSNGLLVGCANGNVMSCGAGAKAGSKLGEGNSGITIDCSLMKRVLSSTDSEEIKNAGNEYYKRGHFSEALTLYDRAISVSPNQASFRSNRAAALTGLGRLGEAVQECEEAIRLDPGFPRAHQRVASLYLRLGLLESAKKHFHAAGQQTDLVDIQRLQNIERHVSKCLEARKSEDWTSVVRESDAAVVAGADSAPKIFGYKAEALLRLHKFEDADAVCSAAQKVESPLIKLNVIPGDPFLLIVRAWIEMALGRFEGAIAAAESAARIDPCSAEVTALLSKARSVGQARATGNELFKAGKYFEALALYGEGLESDPTNAVLLCNRAACRSKLGQWEKAVEDCDAALRVQPNYIKALMRRANCWTKLERWEDALRDYEVLRREMPRDMEVARGFFDVQVAIKKSRGEEIYKMKFGGDVEEVSNDEQFREAVSAPGLSVVQFNTRWSDRCRQIAPLIDELCKRHPCVNFVKVDVDDNPYLAKVESVTFVPTFKMYRNGQKVKEIVGPSLQTLEYAVKHYSL